MLKNNLNLNLYKIFYDVARFGSFSKAAQATYTTQPSISKAIKKLETELDTELFYRKPNGVELTEKGRELLFYVEKSFGSLLIAERILLEQDTLSRGSLSIGLPSNLYEYYILDKIMDFKNKYPKIDISIITGSTSYLLSKLEKHTIDFIIDTLPVELYNNELNIVDLFELNYCFITTNENKKNIHNLKELENENVILPLENTNNRKDINELFIKKDVKLKHILELHTSEMILSTVKNSLGIGYILEELIKEELKNKSIYKLNIKDQMPKAKVVLIYNKKFLTNVPRTFINNYIANIDIPKSYN